MATQEIIQPSFAGGEVTEALQNREDLAKQQVSLKQALNAVVTSTGSIKNRGGFKKAAEVNDSSLAHHLIPFTFSRLESYLLVWGNHLSIVKDGVLTLLDLVDAAYKWTLSADGTSNYYLELSGGGDPGLEEPKRLLENGADMDSGALGALGLNEFDYGDSTGDALGYDTVYVRLSDSADPDSKAQGYVQMVKLFATPYSPVHNIDLDYAQSADVMYLTHGIFYPYKLTRTSDTAWTLIKAPFKKGPWKAFKDDDDEVTMTPSAKTGSGVTITASDTYPMDSNWGGAGDQIQLGYDNPLDISQIDWFYATITGTGTSTTKVVTIEEDLGFEYLLNPKFRDGISFWEDRSIVPCSVTYDSLNNWAVLNRGASGEAYLSQTVTVSPFERMTLEIVVEVVDTVIVVRIGTTDGGGEVLAAQTINAPGTYSYTTLVKQPTASTVYLRIETTGAPINTTHKVSRVSLMRQDLSTRHWRISALSSDQGYPEHVTSLEERFYYGGNKLEQPDTVWATKVGEYESFEFHSPLLDTDAVTFTLASNQVNDIEFMIPHGELIIGTSQEEWRIAPGSTSDTITPTSISAKVKSNAGSAAIKPLVIGKSLLFLNRTADKVYALQYSLDSDSFNPVDLTILAPHLFDGYTITRWCYQKTPDSVVWCVRSDGKLLSLTYIEDQEIAAWSLHDTEGLFESVCVVPESGEDVLYAIIKRFRLESGVRVGKRYIERLMPRISDEDIYDWFQVDSGVTLDIENDITPTETITDIVFLDTEIQIQYSGSITSFANNDYIYISNVAGTTEINQKTFRVSDITNIGGGIKGFKLKDKTGAAYIDASQYSEWVSGGEIRKGISTVTGLEHLALRDVSVLADGSAYTKTVSAGGVVTLNQSAIVVHVGLPYTTEIETLPLDFVGANGVTSQGKDKSLVKANIYFNKSRAAQVSSGDDSTLHEINFSDQSSGNNPPPLFTGVKEQVVDDGNSKITQTFIRNDQPLPIEVTGVISSVDFKEK